MPDPSPFLISPELEELKTRGDDAVAATRRIIRDMRSHATEVRHQVVYSRASTRRGR